MREILEKINELRKTEVKSRVNERIKEFESIDKTNSDALFSELCFCMLTANFQAEKSIKIQRELCNEFSTLPEEELAKKLKNLGHRFPPQRAEFIVKAREHKNILTEIIKNKNEQEIRNWLTEKINGEKRVKGLGMKESSHFLRNIGFKNLAIIDFHIIDLLVSEGLIEKPNSKSPTKNKYLEIEQVLKEIAEKSGLNLAELDLYLWYIETGKILK